MSQEYDNTNKGAMFQAKEKRTENHPDRTGEICTACPHCGGISEFWLAGWIKTSRAGKKYMSLAANPKDAPPQNASTPEDFDDDIPF